MKSFHPVLLEIWRRCCTQIELKEAIPQLVPVLREIVSFDHLALLQLDRERQRVQITGSFGPLTPPADPPTGTERDFHDLTCWCQSGQWEQASAAAFRARLPGLLPASWENAVLAGGLALEGVPWGALVLGTQRQEGFPEPIGPALQAVLEPIAIALRNAHHLRELVRLREAAEADRRSLLARLGRQDIADTLIGSGSGLKEVMRKVELVAPSDAPVLLLGETGSGKEVIARAIHARSARIEGPFLRVNCGAIPPELADSELFGHERGSFTGASSQRKGWFERADGGTLFLDEVGELPPAVQVRLLRILQDGTFERVGGQQARRVDVRLIAATHRDLQRMVGDGRFREDLWYRINVFPIQLPALRERPEDIPAMATHFALRAAERLGLARQLPSPRDMARLIAYPWPGNVRELAAVIERAAILGEGRSLAVEQALGADGTPARTSPASPAAPAPTSGIEPLDTIIRRHIEQGLACTQGRVEGPFGVARLLGVHPDTLRARMRKLGIDWHKYRPHMPSGSHRT